MLSKYPLCPQWYTRYETILEEFNVVISDCSLHEVFSNVCLAIFSAKF